VGVEGEEWKRKKVLLTSLRITIKLFWGVLIALTVELLGLIIKPFDNQTES